MKNINQHNKERRKALTGIMVGGAAVTLWHKPVINSVILPVHAQASATQNFYASVASALPVSTATTGLLDVLIPLAYARYANVKDLIFEAEAISQGGGVYAVKIAAEQIEKNAKPMTMRFFEYAWEGSITGLNASSTFTGSGCNTDDEDVKITAIAGSNMTIEMTYFEEIIQLNLIDGSADLPALPLPCN